MGHHHSPNDDRSNSMNPNNAAYDAALDNHADQLNPNNAEFKGSTDNAGCKENSSKGGNEKGETEK